MALQIRRGTDSSRTSITPDEGELLYTTDTKQLFVGDGTTAGGNVISGGGGGSNFGTVAVAGQGNVVADTNNDTLTLVAGTGISIATDPGADSVTISNNNGQVAYSSFSNVMAIYNTPGDVVTPEQGLGFSSSLGVFQIGNATAGIDGTVNIVRNSYINPVTNPERQGFLFQQHHEVQDANNFVLLRTRGSSTNLQAVINGDRIGKITFVGHDGTAKQACAQISAIVEGTPTLNNVPGKITFGTNNGTSSATRAELSSSGIWKVNSIQNLTGSSLSLTATTVSVTGNLNVTGSISGSFTSTLNYNFVTHNSSVSILSTGAGVVVDGTANVNTVFKCYRGMTYKWTNNTAVTVEFLDSVNTAISSVFLMTSTGGTNNEAGPGQTVTWTIPLNATVGASNYKYRVKTDTGVGAFIEIL